jgi:hypothetical protein
MEYKNPEYLNTFPAYWENSVLKPRPFYHTGFEDSLENIVFKEEPENEKGMLERVFSDKSKTLKATIKALFNEIMLRERLDSVLLYKINEDVCRQHSYLEQLRSLTRFNYSPDLFKDSTNTKMQLENNVLELEKEKRREYLECWRDLMFLKKYLLTALKDYWDLSKRRNTLAYDLNELAENENSKRY